MRQSHNFSNPISFRLPIYFRDFHGIKLGFIHQRDVKSIKIFRVIYQNPVIVKSKSRIIINATMHHIHS